jgi:hypothetical protein
LNEVKYGEICETGEWGRGEIIWNISGQVAFTVILHEELKKTSKFTGDRIISER